MLDLNTVERTIKAMSGTTKGERAKAWEAQGYTIDCAIPQQWVDNTTFSLNIKGNISGHFVTGYKEGDCFGSILPVTMQGYDIALLLELYN